jgi:hypothetical protein
MSRHVHLPPLLPYVGPKPLEKKEKARRKPSILAAATGERADTQPAAAGEAPASAPSAPPPETHNPSPLSTSGGLLAVLLDAQEEAQPPAPPITGSTDDGI